MKIIEKKTTADKGCQGIWTQKQRSEWADASPNPKQGISETLVLNHETAHLLSFLRSQNIGSQDYPQSRQEMEQFILGTWTSSREKT